MKLLSIVIPCYNSQDYMMYCIESLLPGGEDVEILIVNDGSSDQTAHLADEYAKKYPSTVRAIHQENSGHGGAVNTGIQSATGQYFKVVDSDDWVDVRAYLKILTVLRDFRDTNKFVDMILSNFVYEKDGSSYKKRMKYDNVLPEREIFTWDDIGDFRKKQYILMHSIIFRTQILRDCGLELPKHTFYVDNLYVYLPLEYVTKMYYINVDYYRYFIGREDQSVQEHIMIERVDQQIKVNKLIIQKTDLERINNEKLKKYMLKHLEIVTVVSSTLLTRSGTKENLHKRKQLWEYIKSEDREVYRSIRFGLLGQLSNLPGRIGRFVTVTAYKLAQRLIGFN